MDHLNGHAHLTRKDLLDQISPSNLMGPCAVQLIVPFTRKRGDVSEMALCVCSMPLVDAALPHLFPALTVSRKRDYSQTQTRQRRFLASLFSRDQTRRRGSTSAS